MFKKTTGRRWAPTPETIESMRAALGSHWAEAAHAVRQTLFWPSPGRWLTRQTYHFTSGGRLIR